MATIMRTTKNEVEQKSRNIVAKILRNQRKLHKQGERPKPDQVYLKRIKEMLRLQ